MSKETNDMTNQYDEDDDYDYGPNELANLSIDNPRKYRDVVNSNLEVGDTIGDWQQRNLEWAKDCLAQQRSKNRR